MAEDGKKMASIKWHHAHHHNEHTFVFLSACIRQCYKKSAFHRYFLENGIWPEKMDQSQYGEICKRGEKEKMAGRD